MGSWANVGFGLNKTLENFPIPFTTICKLLSLSTTATTLVVGIESRRLLLHAGRKRGILDSLNRHNGAFIQKRTMYSISKMAA